MKANNVHPARSVDFLSRLHDGELAAAERAHFESHRAHCADCRKAALEFEAALTLFRASSTSPPAPDLSARILRKLQAASPRRSPFGVVFGINLKWAAAFAVAILATIVGSVAVIQRESLRKAAARPAPIPVLLQSEQRPAEPKGLLADGADARPRQAANNAPPRKDLAATPLPARERGDVAPIPPAAEEGRVQAQTRRAAEAPAPRSAQAMEAPASPLMRSAESPGGEGAAAATSASAEPGAPARPVLVALDGQGTAPQIITPGAAEVLADLRGRRYFLLVEASGRVLEARSDVGRRAKTQKLPQAAVPDLQTVPRAVWDLRFQATDRPRRLLLRID
jgi:hypothetical protein